MRKLNTKDAFMMMRLLKKTGMRNMVLDMTSKAKETGESVEQIGLNAFFAIMEAISDTENENTVYQFLSGPFEMEPEKIAELDLMTLFDNLKQLAAENNLKSFFTSVSGMNTAGQ